MFKPKYWLAAGAHSTREEGMCAMEFCAYLAGEGHTDSPMCVSDALRSVFTTANDNLDDRNRQKLRPYLARAIGTRGDGHDKARYEMIEAYVNTYGSTQMLWVVVRPELWELLDSLLPTEPLQLPVVEDAEAFFAEPIPA